MSGCCVIFCLMLCIVGLNADPNIDIDYYFGSGRAALRQNQLDKELCNAIQSQYLCHLGCEPNHDCFLKDCWCVDLGPNTLKRDRVKQQRLGYLRGRSKKPHQFDCGFVDLTMKNGRPEREGFLRSKLRELRLPGFIDLTKRDQPERSDYGELRELSPPVFVDLTKSSGKPPRPYDDSYPLIFVRRHHIAHFCPNLDDARACIRKCMPLGKPAFCGKDHVCYCGHKYTNIAGDDKNDPKAVYAQFKDLYQKYFGDNHRGFVEEKEPFPSSEESNEILKAKVKKV